MPSLLKDTDELYIGTDTSSNLYMAYLNKLYDYMMSGKPNIYGTETYNNDVEFTGIGITIKTKNPTKILKSCKYNKRILQQKKEIEKVKLVENILLIIIILQT